MNDKLLQDILNLEQEAYVDELCLFGLLKDFDVEHKKGLLRSKRQAINNKTNYLKELYINLYGTLNGKWNPIEYDTVNLIHSLHEEILLTQIDIMNFVKDKELVIKDKLYYNVIYNKSYRIHERREKIILLLNKILGITEPKRRYIKHGEISD